MNHPFPRSTLLYCWFIQVIQYQSSKMLIFTHSNLLPFQHLEEPTCLVVHLVDMEAQHSVRSLWTFQPYQKHPPLSMSCTCVKKKKKKKIAMENVSVSKIESRRNKIIKNNTNVQRTFIICRIWFMICLWNEMNNWYHLPVCCWCCLLHAQSNSIKRSTIQVHSCNVQAIVRCY